MAEKKFRSWVGFREEEERAPLANPVDRIRELDPAYRAFVAVFDRAIDSARRKDRQRRRASADLTPFHGVPIGIVTGAQRDDVDAVLRSSPVGEWISVIVTEEDVAQLAGEYLANTRVYRRLGRPLFIDKNPNNFRNVGLIRLLFPRAKIIDARRDPMDCCFSNFKQLFASGQQFTYGLGDIGHYYRLYVELMDHWDEVLPGRVLEHTRNLELTGENEVTAHITAEQLKTPEDLVRRLARSRRVLWLNPGLVQEVPRFVAEPVKARRPPRLY